MSKVDDSIKRCKKAMDILQEELDELYELSTKEQAKSKYVPQLGDVLKFKVCPDQPRLVSKVGTEFVVLDWCGSVVNGEYSLIHEFDGMYEFQYNVFANKQV